MGKTLVNVPADAVRVVAAADGVRLQLRVKPGGRSDRLVGPHDGALKLEVRAAPDRGRANDAVIRLLAGVLGVGRADIEVTAGGASRDKVVSVSGLSAGELARRLEAAGIAAEVKDRKVEGHIAEG